jgi:hypothetical protein
MGRKRKEAVDEFVEKFVQKFGPRNLENTTYPIEKEGSYKQMHFKVIETKNNYFIKIGNLTRVFGSAFKAGMWIERYRHQQFGYI